MNLSTAQKSVEAKIREPDTFNRSDLLKLRNFLVTVQLNINGKPKSFDTDAKKISFMLSYLSGAALDWFELELLYGD